MYKKNPTNYSPYWEMSIDRKIKLITYLVACGAGIGIPLFVGIINAWVMDNLFFLFFVVPFLGIVYLAWIYAPYGVGIKQDQLHILRRVGPIAIRIDEIAEMRKIEKLCDEAGWVLRTWGSGGAWGIYGNFWSKKWGHFKMHITKESKLVLLQLHNGKKIVISPDKRENFIQQLAKSNNSIKIS